MSTYHNAMLFICDLYYSRLICYFADDVAELLGGKAIEALAVGNNTYTAHFYSARREENTLILWRKETLRAGFATEEDDGVKDTIV